MGCKQLDRSCLSKRSHIPESGKKRRRDADGKEEMDLNPPEIASGVDAACSESG